ncbi:MAG: ComEC/Rec2 family competence protein [Candidatus Paceibacterota bacterium]
MATIYLYSAVGGFFVGVVLALLGVPAFGLAGLLLVLSVGCLFYVWVSSGDSRQITLVLVLLLAVAAGLLRTGFDINQPNETVFDSQVGQSVIVRGEVADVPEITESGQNLTVAIGGVSLAGSDEVARGESRAVVYAGHFPRLEYGDVVEMRGPLAKPSAFQTDTGRLFNYPRYLARNEVFYELSRPQVTVLSHDGGNSIKRSLARLRTKLLSLLHEHIPDPHAALTGGVLLGAEDALGEELQTAFRDTGLIHIVVLSGYNVTIVAVAIGAALLFVGLPLAVAAGVAGLGIAAFALLVGLTPTVVRASIMAIIALVGRVSSRQYAASRGLLVAAFAMVLVNPHILLFDPSFQLSAIATAGLLSFGDGVSSWLTMLPERFGVREAATATISAQLAVLPFLAFLTGEISIVSVVANLLVLPVVPLLMAVGTLTAAVAWILPPFVLPFAAGAYVVSEYIFTITEKLANFSAATATVGNVSLWAVLGVYFIVIISLILYNAPEE